MATITASTADSVFTAYGLAPTPRYNKVELQGLLEYGVTDRFTAILNPGLQHIDIAAPNSANRTGLGYTEFGGRYRLWQDSDWVVSGQATLRVPGTDATSNPAAVGYTDFETDFRILIGHSFTLAGLPAFTDLQVAERVRTAGAPSEFRVDGTFGVQVTPRWLLLAQSFNVISENYASPIFGSYDYYKLQLSAIYAVTPTWSLQVGAFTAYTGYNALQENGLVFGVGHKF